MKTGAALAVGLAVALAAAGGYWLGRQPAGGTPVATAPAAGAKPAP